MRDVFGPGTILGYCTNVHAGTTFAEAVKNLREYGAAVKARVSPREPMGIGWWLPRSAVSWLLGQSAADVDQVFDSIVHTGLVPFTMNGFPTGDFHASIVKHSVYEPSWSERGRLDYTLSLAAGMLKLAGGESEFSVSTLPLGWPNPPCKPVDIDACAVNLLKLVEELRRIEASSGMLVHVDLEPEPGCILQRSDDVIQFMQERLLPKAAGQGVTEELVLRHIRVCHDICHAAVMFEDQKVMFENYRAAGLRIGKVQISNAIRADLRRLSLKDRKEALNQLRRFGEDRYLHQTMIKSGADLRFFDDLPKALAECGSSDPAGEEWRVHFHVPVYLEEFGLLRTTRDDIIECFTLLKNSGVKHWEVETYAWNVLPPELQVPELADGIAKELQWVRDAAKQINLMPPLRLASSRPPSQDVPHHEASS